MKIKWSFLLIVSLIMTSYLFSSTATLEKAVQVYHSFLEDYMADDSKIPLVKRLKDELKNLAIYKLVRLEVAGSIERKESASSIFDYLTIFYTKNKPQIVEERIALAALLAYIASELSDENLEPSTINNLPAFISAFNDYVLLLNRDFRNLSKNMIAYSLGIVKEIPKGFEDIPVVANLTINADASTFIAKAEEGNLYTDILSIFKETDMENLVLEKSREIYESKPKNFNELNRKINIASNSLLRSLRTVLSSYQLEIAKELAEVTPRHLNFWWLRFLIYFILLGLVLVYFKKALNFLIYAIVGFEAFYIAIFSKGFFGKFDTTVYSLLILVFIFSLFRFIVLLGRRRLSLLTSISGFLLITAYLSMFFIPVYSHSDELKISKLGNFENSIYYDLLKRDLYLDPYSELSRDLSNMYSTASKEYSELKNRIRKFEKFTNDLYNSKAISKISVRNNKLKISTSGFSEFYSIENWSNYNSFFSEIDRDIRDFMWESETRKKRIFKFKSDILSNVRRYSSIFTEKMRRDLYDYFYGFLGKSNTVKFMIKDIKAIDAEFSTKAPQPIKINAYRTRRGNLVILLGLFMGVLMFLSKRSYYKVISIFLLIETVLWIFEINVAEILVDRNIPTLPVSNLSNPNLFIPVIFLILSVLSMFTKKPLKEG